MDWWEKRPQHEVRATRHSERPSVSEIVPELLVGEYPMDTEIGWLKDNYRIDAVHNLQDDEDLRIHGLSMNRLRREYDAHGIKLV